MKGDLRWILPVLVAAALAMSSASARTILVPVGSNPTRFIPQGVGPFLYDPNHSLYEWEIGDKTYQEPCYYDEYYGQWVGPCNISLDQPGYSITIPSRVR